jgi:hypothetical protein
MGCNRIQNVRLIDNEAETRAVFDLISSNHLSRNEPNHCATRS